MQGPVLVAKQSPKLCKLGNSMALVIDRPILKLLNIEDASPLYMSTDGKVLIITPVRDKKRPRAFGEVLEKTNRRHGRLLKSLSD
jgi:antitoxin MazE